MHCDGQIGVYGMAQGRSQKCEQTEIRVIDPTPRPCREVVGRQVPYSQTDSKRLEKAAMSKHMVVTVCTRERPNMLMACQK